MSFSQLPAVEKDTEKWAAGKILGPSYFEATLLYSVITPKSEEKYAVKVFNWSEFHLSEMTLLQNPYFRQPAARV